MSSLQHDYEVMVKRYDSMCEGAEAQSKQIVMQMDELAKLRVEVTRLGAESLAAQNNAQLLGDDYNDRSKASNDEIVRLRNLLTHNGLNPEAGVPNG